MKIKPDVRRLWNRKSGPIIATTKAQKHQGIHKEKLFVSSFVSSCLCGCDGFRKGAEDAS